MKWKITEKEYIYDGTIEGLLTIIYHLISLKEIPRVISPEENYETNLLCSPIFMETNQKKFETVLTKVRSISKQAAYFILTGFKSKDKEKEIIIFKYILNLLKYGAQLNYMKSIESVIKMSTIVKQVNLEIHRMDGFLRFDSLANNILYARFSPDNDIIRNVAYNFKQKLREESWIIHDTNRMIVAVYDKKQLQFYYDFNFELKDLLDDEYSKLWKEYFKRISIKERENKRCQKNFMPKRYWHNMLEVKEEI